MKLKETAIEVMNTISLLEGTKLRNGKIHLQSLLMERALMRNMLAFKKINLKVALTAHSASPNIQTFPPYCIINMGSKTKTQ